MRIKIVDNESGDSQIVAINGCEMLIGSIAECDVVLAKGNNPSSPEIYEHHALLAQLGHHIYLRTKRDEYGIINSFFPDDPNEPGSKTNWDPNDRRIDAEPFEVGHYTICAFR